MVNDVSPHGLARELSFNFFHFGAVETLGVETPSIPLKIHMKHPCRLVDELTKRYRQEQFQGVTVFQHLVPQAELVSIQDLCASSHGFAALRTDGRVFHWGLQAKEDPSMVPKGELQGEITFGDCLVETC